MDSTLLIAIAAVFIVSIIFSMFGQGGGSLYTPILFLLGYATLTSISTSLVLNLITALAASIVYYRSNLIDIRFALWFVPGICLGAFLGGVAAAYINPVLLMWLFVIFLIGAGGRMIYTYWEKSVPEGACPVHYSTGMYALIVAFSFFVGIISGLLGVGGGILIVPFLIFLCRYPTKNSAGVVSFIVIFSSLFGVFGHLTSGGFDIPLIIGCAVAVVIGATIGARSMVKISSGYIKAGFGVILLVFAIQLIFKLVHIF
ncbi:sulfite exporter TauE/SafE family protein [Methanoregula sp.]|uniref:sulfite exporter TauE/SafE family protein n=1 Tax=Methanoregula sp. TaxID=2052170 RepID=UPI0035691A2F